MANTYGFRMSLENLQNVKTETKVPVWAVALLLEPYLHYNLDLCVVTASAHYSAVGRSIREDARRFMSGPGARRCALYFLQHFPRHGRNPEADVR